MGKKENSKHVLLMVARALFAEKGFNGVSTQEISKQAQISHGLLFHYFKSKEGLWTAVKEDIERDYSQKHCLNLSTKDSFDQFLKHLIHHYVDFYETNPEIRKVLAWQRLEFPQLTERQYTLSDDFVTLSNYFREYQRKGDIETALDPRYITFYVFSLIEATASTLSLFLPPSERNSYLSFCKNRIKKSLR